MTRSLVYPFICGLAVAASLSLTGLDPYGGAFIAADDPVLRVQMPTPPSGALIGAVLLVGLAMPLVARPPRSTLRAAG
jgi:hypothetical protein